MRRRNKERFLPSLSPLQHSLVSSGGSTVPSVFLCSECWVAMLHAVLVCKARRPADFDDRPLGNAVSGVFIVLEPLFLCPLVCSRLTGFHVRDASVVIDEVFSQWTLRCGHFSFSAPIAAATQKHSCHVRCALSQNQHLCERNPRQTTTWSLLAVNATVPKHPLFQRGSKPDTQDSPGWWISVCPKLAVSQVMRGTSTCRSTVSCERIVHLHQPTARKLCGPTGRPITWRSARRSSDNLV